MKTVKLLLVALFLFTVACSEDDSNPSASAEAAGTYSGSSSQGQPVTVTISGINGETWVTGYNFEYEFSSGGGTISGSSGETDSDGIVKVNNNKFEISLGDDADQKFEGTINGNTINGSFTYPVTPDFNTTATFTLTK